MKKVHPISHPSKWHNITTGALLLCWVAASIIVAQLVVGYFLLWTIGAESLQQTTWSAVYSAAAYTFALLLIILVPWKLFRKWRSDRQSLGLKDLPTWTDIGLGIVGFIVATLLAALLVKIFEIFPWFDASETQDVGFSGYLYGTDRIIAFLTLVIVAPIAEELIFRGWLYEKLRNRFAIPLAIILTSLLFGLLHGQWNVGVNVFALSLVLCGLREVTGTIYAGILVHIIKNGVAFYLLYMI